MYPGANKRAAAYPVDLRPHVKLEYFDKRQQPGLHTLFRNPMLLMMGFTMLMVFFMPKLMDSLDPEERKRMEEQMSNSSDPQKMIKGLFGLSDEKESDSEEEGRRGAGRRSGGEFGLYSKRAVCCVVSSAEERGAAPRFTQHLGEDAPAVRGDQVGVEVLERGADDRELHSGSRGPSSPALGRRRPLLARRCRRPWRRPSCVATDRLRVASMA